MKIETTVKGLNQTKRNQLVGLVSYDAKNDISVFEWKADQGPPHDYASAIARVRTAVTDLGGTVGEFRIVG